MKFGIIFANTGRFAGRAGLTELARSAEACGFESLWTVEHVIFPEEYASEYPYDPSGRLPGGPGVPMPDPLQWLAFAAAATERIRLGTGILILPQRNPLVLAKEVATLDDLSGGRVELGIGVGWLREEFEALGVPFERRGARADEYVAVLRSAWAGDGASFHGEFADFDRVSVNPKPPGGTVPIHVGGHSRAAAARAGRLGDGFFPGKGDLGELVDVLRQSAADAGRDAASIEVTSWSPGVFGSDPVGAVEELAAHGVDRTVVPAFLFHDDTPAALAAFAERVVAPTSGA